MRNHTGVKDDDCRQQRGPTLSWLSQNIAQTSSNRYHQKSPILNWVSEVQGASWRERGCGQWTALKERDGLATAAQWVRLRSLERGAVYIKVAPVKKLEHLCWNARLIRKRGKDTTRGIAVTSLWDLTHPQGRCRTKVFSPSTSVTTSMSALSTRKTAECDGALVYFFFKQTLDSFWRLSVWVSGSSKPSSLPSGS